MAPVLKFLRFSNGPSADKDLAIIDKAAQYAQSNQIDVEIIQNPYDIKSLISVSVPDKQSIFICFPFDGKIFENLKQKGYRIIGPQCVVSCLLLEMPVPKQSYPVCNVAMTGVVACCSSMKKGERTQIHDLILVMGGEVNTDFTTAVTHLIAKEVGSKKYQVACQNNIPVVLPSWVHSCWTKSQYNHIVAKDMVSDFMVPIFQGCTICVTGIDANTRESVKMLIQNNGGVYSGELNMKTCTHLLVEHPRGQKYTYARQWKLHCVSPSWLYDSFKQKQWLDEKAYYVEPDTDTTVNQTSYQKSEIQNTFRESLLPVNSNKRLSSKVVENAAKSMENSLKVASANIENKNDTNNFHFKNFNSKSLKLEKFIAPNEAASYLDGTCIYLCNKAGPILDYCRKVINHGGAIRFSTLSDSVTHIVQWDDVPKEVRTFLSDLNGPLPHIVSPLWLIESFKRNERRDEQDYSLLVMSDYEQSELHINDVFVKPQPKSAKPATASSLHINFEDDDGDDTTLLNQYLGDNHESTRLSEVGVVKNPSDDKEETTLQDDATVTMDEGNKTILNGKTLVIQRFTADQKAHITNLVGEFGGSITDNTSTCDHIIVPLSYPKKMKINKKEVTLCWLERSLEQEEIFDPKSSFLFKPIFISEKSKPLQNCVITISQYAGIERQHLFHLAELLGGVGQDYFVRHDTETTKASTHLILKTAEGSKYNASVKWNVPCVSKQWLFKCAQKGKRLNENGFPITNEETVMEEENLTEDESVIQDKTIPIHSVQKDEVVSFELSNRGASLMEEGQKNNTVLNDVKKTKTDECRIKNDFSHFNELIAKEKEEVDVTLKIDKSDKSEVSRTPIIPIKPPLELNKSRYSFDFSDALDCVPSPAAFSQDSLRRKSRKSRGSLPFDLQFAEAMQRAVNKHVPEADRIMWNDDKKNKTSSNGVLADVVVVVSKKLTHRQAELHQIVNELGGDTRFMYDQSCTHFVHQAKLNDNSKDFLEAKKNKKFLVSPYWLEYCAETKSRVDEDKYPVTYNPRMTIDVTSTKSFMSPKSVSNAKEVPVNAPTDDELPAEKSPIMKNEEMSHNPTAEEAHEKTNFQKKMEEIMGATNKAPRPRRTRRQTNTSLSKNDVSNTSGSGTRKLRSRNSSQKSIDSSRSSNSDPSTSKHAAGVEHISEQSQGDYITYDDPTGRVEREKILAQLKRASPSQDIESLNYPLHNIMQPGLDDVTEVEDDVKSIEKAPSPPHPQISFPISNDSPKSVPVNLLRDDEQEKVKKREESSKRYQFILSGMTAQEKIGYAAVIEKLGGTVYDVQYFNTQCTHAIISVPSRNEKYLATVASGKWALHKSFLEASREQDDFVNEEKHEWGSQAGATEFASAAKRWRLELTEKRVADPNLGAFTGWGVLLCIEPSKQPGFKRILEAGGAKVLAVRPPFETMEGVTHAFIGDKRQAMKSKVDYEQLHDAGIWILKPEYIADYLTVFPKPPTFNYLVDEAKTLNDQNTSGVTPGKRKTDAALPTRQKRSRR